MKNESIKNTLDEQEPFWQRKKLTEMTPEEWESLCDGCAKCCLCKLEDDETGQIYHTNVSCKLLDPGTCRCKSYPNRRQLVKTCAVLTPENVRRFRWLPETCAYKLVARGKDLFKWHHLVSGDREQIHKLGLSVKNRVISEEYIHPDQLTEHIIGW